MKTRISLLLGSAIILAMAGCSAQETSTATSDEIQSTSKTDPLPDTIDAVGKQDSGHDNSDGHHDTVAPEHSNADGHHDTVEKPADDNEIRLIIAAIESGWETGNGAPFKKHFLDFDGARYFESGGENTGLNDLVENHVEPEKITIPDLELDFTNIQIHYENDFAWAVADSTVKGTITKTGRVLDRTGKQTYLFRKMAGEWKVVHTHSSSRAARR